MHMIAAVILSAQGGWQAVGPGLASAFDANLPVLCGRKSTAEFLFLLRNVTFRDRWSVHPCGVYQ